jgi:cytochrome c oxidase subunit 1
MPLHKFITIAALITGAGQLVFLVNLIHSRFRGKLAPDNPWNGTSLEWSIPSPPPWNNFGADHPIVYHDPYQYGVKGAMGDFVMQTSPEKIENEAT